MQPHVVHGVILGPLCRFDVFQQAFQVGIYWAHTNTVHKSRALKLVHEQTSPRWKEDSGSEMLTLDEEGCVEADIPLGALPGRQKVKGRGPGVAESNAKLS